MVDQRDSLAREIDEELRREQLLKLWERYGTTSSPPPSSSSPASAATSTTSIAAPWPPRRPAPAWRRRHARPAQNKKAEAQKALEDIAANAPASYAVLARLRLAAAEREAGKTAEAAAAFEAIAKDSGVDPLLSRLCAAAGGHVEAGRRQLDGHAESAQRSCCGRQRVAVQRQGAAWAGRAEGRQDRRGAHRVHAVCWAIAARRPASPSVRVSCWRC